MTRAAGGRTETGRRRRGGLGWAGPLSLALHAAALAGLLSAPVPELPPPVERQGVTLVWAEQADGAAGGGDASAEDAPVRDAPATPPPPMAEASPAAQPEALAPAELAPEALPVPPTPPRAVPPPPRAAAAPPPPPGSAAAPAPPAPATPWAGEEPGPGGGARAEGAAVVSGQPQLCGPSRPPAYPDESRRNAEQGTVVLRVTVMQMGPPAAVLVERSSGHPALDEAAMRAVRDWCFMPVLEGGAPMLSSRPVPVTFRLQGESLW